MCQGPGVRRSDRAIAWDRGEGRQEVAPQGSAGPGPPAGRDTLWTGGRSGMTQGSGLSNLEDNLSSGGRGSGQGWDLDSPLQVPSCPSFLSLQSPPPGSLPPASCCSMPSAPRGFVGSASRAATDQWRGEQHPSQPLPAGLPWSPLLHWSPKVSQLSFPKVLLASWGSCPTPCGPHSLSTPLNV